MPPTFNPETYLDAVASAHGLNLTGERRTKVLVQLQRIHDLAQSFLEFPLDDHVEPAPNFLPTSVPSPSGGEAVGSGWGPSNHASAAPIPTFPQRGKE